MIEAPPSATGLSVARMWNSLRSKLKCPTSTTKRRTSATELRRQVRSQTQFGNEGQSRRTPLLRARLEIESSEARCGSTAARPTIHHSITDYSIAPPLHCSTTPLLRAASEVKSSEVRCGPSTSSGPSARRRLALPFLTRLLITDHSPSPASYNPDFRAARKSSGSTSGFHRGIIECC
jgi:hypothetical protein